VSWGRNARQWSTRQVSEHRCYCCCSARARVRARSGGACGVRRGSRRSASATAAVACKLGSERAAVEHAAGHRGRCRSAGAARRPPRRRRAAMHGRASAGGVGPKSAPEEAGCGRRASMQRRAMLPCSGSRRRRGKKKKSFGSHRWGIVLVRADTLPKLSAIGPFRTRIG
jgi:hypothetical protein